MVALGPRAAVTVLPVGRRHRRAFRLARLRAVCEPPEDRADPVEAVRTGGRGREVAHLDRPRRAGVVRGEIARATVDALALHRTGEVAELDDLAWVLDRGPRGVAPERLEAGRDPFLL